MNSATGIAPTTSLNSAWHRMASAKCDFYMPKQPIEALLLVVGGQGASVALGDPTLLNNLDTIREKKRRKSDRLLCSGNVTQSRAPMKLCVRRRDRDNGWELRRRDQVRLPEIAVGHSNQHRVRCPNLPPLGICWNPHPAAAEPV